MDSGWAAVIGSLVGGLGTFCATWLNAELTRRKRDPAEEAAKELLRSLLNRPRWNWASIKTLGNVVGADEVIVRRLLLEIGARGSMQDSSLWGLVARNPIDGIANRHDDPEGIDEQTSNS